MLKFAVLVTSFGLLALAGGCEKTAIEGPGGKKLTLSKPADQTIKRGETNDVKVSVSRTNFRDAVAVRFENLPAGVTVQDKDRKIAAEENSATFTLHAAPDAAIVSNQEVKVTVVGPDGMSVMESFKLNVKDKG